MENKILKTYQEFITKIPAGYRKYLSFTINMARKNHSDFPATIAKFCIYSKEIEDADGYIIIDEDEKAILLFREKETKTKNYDGWCFWSDLMKHNKDLPSHPSDCGESVSKEKAIEWLSMENTQI